MLFRTGRQRARLASTRRNSLWTQQLLRPTRSELCTGLSSLRGAESFAERSHSVLGRPRRLSQESAVRLPSRAARLIRQQA